VSGHGIKGALVTANIKSIINSGYVSKHRNASFSPADFLSWLNRQVCQKLKHLPDTIITFAACLMNLREKKLLFAKAGHLPLVLARAGKIIEVDAQGAGMGVTPDLQYQNAIFTLQANDILYLFTDGLVERNSYLSKSNFLDWKALFITKPREDDGNDEIVMRAQKVFPDETFVDDVTLISIRLKK
jgi:serine phosphatase RsbU (regulator of sigma subunit)